MLDCQITCILNVEKHNGDALLENLSFFCSTSTEMVVGGRVTVAPTLYWRSSLNPTEHLHEGVRVTDYSVRVWNPTGARKPHVTGRLPH